MPHSALVIASYLTLSGDQGIETALEGVMASAIEASKWYHSNKYTADTACGHCAGGVRHESWGPACKQGVAYAYEAVDDAARLTVEDGLILHALGAAWI